jgi:hypothetical protein
MKNRHIRTDDCYYYCYYLKYNLYFRREKQFCVKGKQSNRNIIYMYYPD